MQKYLNTATFRISLLLPIKSWTFWYIERRPTSSYTDVIHFQIWSRFLAHPGIISVLVHWSDKSKVRWEITFFHIVRILYPVCPSHVSSCLINRSVAACVKSDNCWINNVSHTSYVAWRNTSTPNRFVFRRAFSGPIYLDQFWTRTRLI